jgi:hypothetical protein
LNYEFKKKDVTSTTIMQQQSKNIRTNCCILNDINLITKNNSNEVLFFDFVGQRDTWHNYLDSKIQ